jgi:leucyl-tRNA synthetase
MANYDLRRAVEISHYELIKDINWYTRRGGNNAGVGRTVLESWTYLISVSTPHLAEEWGRCISLENMVSASQMKDIGSVSNKEASILDYEFIMRGVLENARKVKTIAEKHLQGEADKLTLIVSPEWKNNLSMEAISYLQNGGNVKQFIQELKQMDFVNGANMGEILSYWNKKMLSQVFKWDDKAKGLILDNIDEAKILSDRASFIAEELGLSDVEIVKAENYQGTDGRENSAMPLSPSIIFA